MRYGRHTLTPTGTRASRAESDCRPTPFLHANPRYTVIVALTAATSLRTPSAIEAARLDRARSSLGARSRPATSCALWSTSEEHTSELQSLMRISYAVFCLKKKIHQ